MTANPAGGEVHAELDSWVDEAIAGIEPPGLAVGVRYDGAEQHVFRGITSVDNPQEVDSTTAFHWASIGKTITATMLLHLVERGDLDLDAPLRRYLPELRLRDAAALAAVRVSHLLNHTAGWAGDVPFRDGPRGVGQHTFLDALAQVPQLTRPGTLVSYNNAGFIVAGCLFEAVSRTDYAEAVHDLVLGPLGMRGAVLDPTHLMTRRFAVGHESVDGRHVVVGPWPTPTYARAAGGVAGTSEDLLRWARFHLADPDLVEGAGLLGDPLRKEMQTATASATGSELGDAVGLGWFLRNVGGVEFVGHSGVATGQVARLDLAPARDFAICILTNSGTLGPRLVGRIRRRIVAELLGVAFEPPKTRAFTADEGAALVGRYTTEELVIDVDMHNGGLVLTIRVAPRDRETGDRVITDEQFSVPVGVAQDESSLHIVGLRGQFEGVRGRFLPKDVAGVEALDFGGRLALRQDAGEVG